MIENMERGARNIGVEELRAQVDKASFATIDALKSPLGADKRSFYEGLLENLNGARAWMSYNKLRYTSAVVLGITFLTWCAPAIVVVPIPDGEPNRPTITQTAPIPTETATVTKTPTPSPESLLEPAQEIVTTPSGVGFELGAQIEGQPEGVKEVVDILPSSMWNAEKKADYEERVDPTTYGFAEGETRFVYIPTEDGKYRVELQRTSNPANVIAVFGSNDFVWKISEMVDENGDPVFLNAGKIVEMRGGVPVNSRTTGSAASRLTQDFVKIKNNQFYHDHYIFVSKDGKRGVQFSFTATEDGNNSKGYVYFRDQDGRTVRYLYVEGFDNKPGFVRRLTR